uniref:Uncharacterized protein n=1 Tax=Panthera leo TaxID=9689 RepID=A0A8C8XQL0_PANLE
TRSPPLPLLPGLLALGLGRVCWAPGAGARHQAHPPASYPLLRPILRGALSRALVLGLLSGFLDWSPCCRVEKLTTPVEESGGKCCPEMTLI